MLTASLNEQRARDGRRGLKNETRKRFCENICSVFNTWSVFDDERPRFNVRANEVIANVDVLGLAMVGPPPRDQTKLEMDARSRLSPAQSASESPERGR